MKRRVPLSAAIGAILSAAAIAAYLGQPESSGDRPTATAGAVQVIGSAHPWPRLPAYRSASGWAALPARRHPVPATTPVSSEAPESTEAETYVPAEEPVYVPSPEPAPSSGGSSGSREFGVTYSR